MLTPLPRRKSFDKYKENINKYYEAILKWIIAKGLINQNFENEFVKIIYFVDNCTIVLMKSKLVEQELYLIEMCESGVNKGNRPWPKLPLLFDALAPVTQVIPNLEYIDQAINKHADCFIIDFDLDISTTEERLKKIKTLGKEWPQKILMIKSSIATDDLYLFVDYVNVIASSFDDCMSFLQFI